MTAKPNMPKKPMPARLADVMVGADMFLGLSTAGIVNPAMVASMANSPIIFALANPTPEIMPEEIKAVRKMPLLQQVARTIQTKSITPYASLIFLEAR
jgi:malic enzyme